MAAPKEVTNVTVSEGTQFKQGGGAVHVRTVTYFVGDHGPFFVTLPVAEFSDEKVQREMENTVKSLRNVGALPGGA